MKTMSTGKKKYLDQLTNEEGIIGALAIDQRGALKKMIGKYKEATTEDVIKFKELV
ncbi:MAG: tagatose-bisphosphate aldolase, partial [Enterococcus gilvus]